MKFAVISFFIFTSVCFSQTQITISGKVKDSITKAPLFNTNIYVESTGTGTATDSSGMFNLNISPGFYKIKFSYVGYESKIISMYFSENIFNLDIELTPSAIEQKQVNVRGEKYPSSTVIQTIEGRNIKECRLFYPMY